MSKPEVKHPDIRAALAKAGGPSPSALLDAKPQRRKRPRKVKPTHECPKEALCLKEREGLDAALRKATRETRMLTEKLDTVGQELSLTKRQQERDQRRIHDTDEILVALRKVIGAGKDAKASSLPRRIAGILAGKEEAETVFSLIRDALGLEDGTPPSILPESITRLTARLELLEDQSRGRDERESSLLEELEGLRQELRTHHEELDKFKDLADTTILVGGSLMPGEKPSPMEVEPTPVDADESWSQADEIVPTFFTQVISSEPLDMVKSAYVSWVLGIGSYDRSRPGRTQLGISKTWIAKDLLENPPINLEGTKGTEVVIRETDEGWVMRFVHPDSKVEGTSWWNLARLSRHPEGTKIEHALIRMTGAKARRPGTGTQVPNVLKDLFNTADKPFPWEDFGGDTKQVRSDNADMFIQGILLNPARDIPVVVASRTIKSDAFTIPPRDLRKALYGIAVVFEVGRGSPFLLNEALKANGIDPRMRSCYDGSIRVYLPGFSAESDPYKHTLWTRTFIESKDTQEATRVIARKVAAYSVDLRTPPGFTRLIEEHDLKVATEHASSLENAAPSAEQVEAMQRRVKVLLTSLDHAKAEAQQVPALRMRLEELESRSRYSSELEQLTLQENAILKGELEESKHRLFNMRAQLDQAEARQRSEAETPSSFQDILDGIAGQEWSPIGAHARVLQARYPDRLVLLPKALSSADACEFEPPSKPKQMLTKLVTDYYEALANGSAGDVVGAKVFGKDGYASHESDNLSATGIRARTFHYDGKEVRMDAHLKITRSFERGTSRQLFRAHFYWDSQRNLIVVGHIGCHLPE